MAHNTHIPYKAWISMPFLVALTFQVVNIVPMLCCPQLDVVFQYLWKSMQFLFFCSPKCKPYNGVMTNTSCSCLFPLLLCKAHNGTFAVCEMPRMIFVFCDNVGRYWKTRREIIGERREHLSVILEHILGLIFQHGAEPWTWGWAK